MSVYIYDLRSICVTNDHVNITSVLMIYRPFFTLTYQMIFNKSNTAGATSRAGTVYHPVASEFITVV
jgi:hypothetical protein